MRIVIMTAAAALAISGPALAKGNPQMKTCAAQWKAQAAHGSQTYKQFMATCLHSGTPTSAPTSPNAPAAGPNLTPLRSPTPGASAGTAPGAAPAGATAKCKDGTYSHSAHHSGSCSHHGGVAQFLS